MNTLPNDKVILFPKTVEYYQFELTRLLEAERYGEAMKLLSFLLGCRLDNGLIREEWRSLLDWLGMMFPEGSLSYGENEENEAPEENDLLREHLAGKGEKSKEYAERLLTAIKNREEPGKLMMALDQLAFLNHPEIDDTLKDWLSEEELHPLLQFKALQTLKKRGASGSLTLRKQGDTIVLDLEDTPADYDKFPVQIQEIIERVHDICEVKHPDLTYFAAQTWNEFLAYIYGTSSYRQMLRQDAACVDVWAAALHLTLLERVFDGGNKEETAELYGITSELEFQWEQACRVLQQFAAVMFSKRL